MAKKPSHRAFIVTKREDKEDFWTNVGIVYPHDDQEGFNVLLQALPIDGKLVLRTYKEEDDDDKSKSKKRDR